MSQPSPPRLTQAGNIIHTLPDCPGIYRFLDRNGCALYIGKSINIRSRVKTHLAEARGLSRKHRMLSETKCIDVRPTAGEIGALLLENDAIKKQAPAFNRRQRSIKKMWSYALTSGRGEFCVPTLQSYSMHKPEILANYGAYTSPSRAKKALEQATRDHGLCPRILGLEAGKGPCFNFQIGRCRGACADFESAESHNRRLKAALRFKGFSAWPVASPVLLHEVASDPSLQPAQEWHLLHNWAYLGTFDTLELARSAKLLPGFMFDKDTYHILRRALKHHPGPILRADTLEPIEWLEPLTTR